MVKKKENRVTFKVETLERVENQMKTLKSFKPYELYESLDTKPNWYTFMNVIRHLKEKGRVTWNEKTGVYSYV